MASSRQHLAFIDGIRAVSSHRTRRIVFDHHGTNLLEADRVLSNERHDLEEVYISLIIAPRAGEDISDLDELHRFGGFLLGFLSSGNLRFIPLLEVLLVFFQLGGSTARGEVVVLFSLVVLVSC